MDHAVDTTVSAAHDVDQNATAGRDVDWLRARVIELFDAARQATEPDHAVCAKYAELLYKLLPKAVGKQGAGIATEVRRAVWEEISKSSTTPAEP